MFLNKVYLKINGHDCFGSKLLHKGVCSFLSLSLENSSPFSMNSDSTSVVGLDQVAQEELVQAGRVLSDAT